MCSFYLPSPLQTVHAICVCLSSKTNGVVSAPIQYSNECPVAFNCKYSSVLHRYLKANYLPNVHLFIMGHGMKVLLLFPFCEQ